MGAFKQFTTKEVTITPFLADKGFTFTAGEITGSEVGINIFLGQNLNYTSSSNTQTGFVYSSSKSSIYNSAKQLYYTNYISSSTGDSIVTASVIPGVTREDDYYYGPIEAPLYENYLQSSLTQQRYWPTGSGDGITTIAIPTKLYGEKIVPNTFEYSITSPTFPNGLFLTDDGEGNIISGSEVVGQLFYPHGIAVLTTHSCNIIGKEVTNPEYFNSQIISFSSSLTIFENQFKCTILENEFGSSLNPSLLTSSIDGGLNTAYYPYVTSSFFTPYVTQVGLYNESNQLVAVGKLSFPVPISQYTDTTILVNFDI
mgnify:CR=1 FL=1|tara:strand:+ start:20466 stop:21404 length:939 start_codon:yes stop_codon:yes gene_type:complete